MAVIDSTRTPAAPPPDDVSTVPPSMMSVPGLLFESGRYRPSRESPVAATVVTSNAIWSTWVTPTGTQNGTYRRRPTDGVPVVVPPCGCVQ